MPKPSKSKKYLTTPFAIVAALAIVSTSLLAYGQATSILYGAAMWNPLDGFFLQKETKAPSVRLPSSASSVGTVTTVPVSVPVRPGITCTVQIIGDAVVATVTRPQTNPPSTPPPALGRIAKIMIVEEMVVSGGFGSPYPQEREFDPLGTAQTSQSFSIPKKQGASYYARCRVYQTDNFGDQETPEQVFAERVPLSSGAASSLAASVASSSAASSCWPAATIKTCFTPHYVLGAFCTGVNVSTTATDCQSIGLFNDRTTCQTALSDSKACTVSITKNGVTTVLP